MSLPEITLCILTYRRPWYAIITLQAMIGRIQYDGPRKFLVSDGGSEREDLDAYHQVLSGHPHEIVITPDMGGMVNACTQRAGEVWWMTMDDFAPRTTINLSPDTNFLLQNGDVGAVRMGRLAYWEHGPNEEIHARMRMLGGLHWWVFDKERTTHPYVCCLNTFLYHRRFWDAYGILPAVPPDIPGEAETEMAKIYKAKQGPTVAIPMRFGEDCGEWLEPIDHFGRWRSDSYAASGGRRM